MKTDLRTVMAVAALLALPLVCRAGVDELPTVAPARLATTPKIDGNLDDPVWREVPEAGPLFDIRDATRILTQRTTFKVGYSPEALCLGITCWGDDPKALVTGATLHDDSGVFNDNSVEIFVDPGRGEREYFQFVCNAFGATWDAKNTYHPKGDPVIGRKWEGRWTSAVSRGDNRWTVELAIPFETLGRVPKPGEKWGLGVNRNIKAKTKDIYGNLVEIYAMWSPSTLGYQDVKKFGNLWFSGEKEVLATIRKRCADLRSEAESIHAKFQPILKNKILRQSEFEERLAALFDPILKANANESPYLQLGSAQVALTRIQAGWKDLYYDMQFAILLNE